MSRGRSSQPIFIFPSACWRGGESVRTSSLVGVAARVATAKCGDPPWPARSYTADAHRRRRGQTPSSGVLGSDTSVKYR